MNLNRRDFLKTASGVAALSLGLNAFSPPLIRRRLLAGPVTGKKRLLFIFQRGGMDGINAVIPRGDAEYNASNRPSLYIGEGQVANAQNGGTDLGNGFAQLNPALYKMMDLYRDGELAVIHRVGYRNQSRSHFNSQQYWENGTYDNDLEVGMFNRLITEGTATAGTTIPAIGLDRNLMVSLRGPAPVTNFSQPSRFRLGNEAESAKFLGRKNEPGQRGRGLLHFYSNDAPAGGNPYSKLVFGTGIALADSMSLVRDIDPDTYVPAPGAEYPGGGFGEKLRTCAQILKETPVQILGVNRGGWDTHSNQDRNFGDMLDDIASAYQALSVDLRAAGLWQDTVIVTMTEFGRTSRENGSQGTDHAEATAMWVGGGGVAGGVYNCDANTWQDGDIFSTDNGRYLAHRTDFRQVFSEIFTDHFGDSPQVLSSVIPRLEDYKADDPAGFQRLGFMRT